MSKAEDVRLIRHKVETDPLFAVHVFRTIYDAQDAREKYLKEWNGIHDGYGFRPDQTRRWCTFYERCEDSGWRLSPYEMKTLMEGMVQHGEQFWDLAHPTDPRSRVAKRKEAI